MPAVVDCKQNQTVISFKLGYKNNQNNQKNWSKTIKCRYHSTIEVQYRVISVNTRYRVPIPSPSYNTVAIVWLLYHSNITFTVTTFHLRHRLNVHKNGANYRKHLFCCIVRPNNATMLTVKFLFPITAANTAVQAYTQNQVASGWQPSLFIVEEKDPTVSNVHMNGCVFLFVYDPLFHQLF